MNRTIMLAVLASGSLLAGCAAQTRTGTGDIAKSVRIFETDITRNLNMSSGEPQIAIDRTNPENLAIVEFTLGSDKRPAWKFNPVAGARTPEEADESMRHMSRVMISNDGGDTWRERPSPANSPDHSPGGGDPMIASGPDGSLYVANEPFPRKLGDRSNMSKYTFVIAHSADWGKTFGPAHFVGTPVNRPWLQVDQSTGKVYTASTGTIHPKTGTLNMREPDAIMDRWLVAWQPGLRGKSEPRRMGGPDFNAAGGSTHVAAHGRVASVFVLGGPVPGMGPARGDTPIPESLRPLVKDGTTTCSMAAPCLFFQSSSDDGLSWQRHHVPIAGGFSGFLSYVAADEGKPGRFAIGTMTRDLSGIRVVTTDDWGETWSDPSVVVDVAKAEGEASAEGVASTIAYLSRGAVTKPWMAYGPSGVLGFMWKQARTEIPGPSAPPQSPIVVWGPGFDVYAGISCDGGRTWLPPVRVNAETSPRGPSAQDDLSYIALDKNYAHLVWGDRRDIMKITNEPMGAGGLQAYYGRVPFAAVAKGRKCGRP